MNINIIKTLGAKLSILHVKNLTVWHQSLFLELLVALHWIFRSTCFFLENDAYHLKYSHLITIILSGWAIVICPIKCYLLWTGISRKSMSRLETYSWINIATDMTIIFPLTIYIRVGVWIYSPDKKLIALEILIIMFGHGIVVYYAYYFVPLQLRKLRMDLVAMKNLKQQLDNMSQEPVQQYCIENVNSQQLKKCLIRSWDIWIDKSFKIGKGQFGSVYHGILSLSQGGITEIAAKTSIQTGTDLTTICNEIKINLCVGQHINVVQFYGVCGDPSGGSYFLISEYCEGGSLKEYLDGLKPIYSRYLRNAGNLGPSHNYVNQEPANFRLGELAQNLLRITVQICAGMEHLSSRKIVHGDCAARNVLMSGTLVPKVADFGMSHKLYHYQLYSRNMQQELMPWRWMSVECLEDLKFSEKSDVWAYGVLLYEIYSLGQIPFGNLGWSLDFPSKLRNGVEKLEQPGFCDEKLFNIMRMCWAVEPDKRPNFTTLNHELKNLMIPQETRFLKSWEECCA